MGDIRPPFVEEVLVEIKNSGKLNYRSKSLPTWCPGCGYFAMVDGLTVAFKQLNIPYEDIVVVSGIGCASRFPFFINSYGFHTLHGRALPIATGIKTANPKLNVVVVGGDGDGYAIGGAHMPHGARRNLDITYMLFDNGIYGLTKGQTSPTSAYGFKTGTTPTGNLDSPINPILTMLTHGASWIGQSYAGNPAHLQLMITQALEHKGFSYLHIISPCVTFDKTDKTYKNLNATVRELSSNHNPRDKMAAIKESLNDETPAIGIFYQEEKPTLDDNLNQLIENATKK